MRALILRWCAYGDALIMLPLIEEVKRRFQYVHLETGERGKEILECHPALGKITTFDHNQYTEGKDEFTFAASQIRWRSLAEAGPWAFSVNLWRTLEVECIAEDWQDEFYWPRERRQEHFGNKIFVEAPFIRAKLPMPKEFRMGTMFFPTGVALWMRHWAEIHRDTLNIAVVVSGSTCQKIPMGLKELCKKISDEYPEARFFLLGTKQSGWMPMPLDMEDLQFDFGRKNVSKLVGKTPFLQALAIMKMADYVIGPVSSLLHGAGMFGTPKSMICTDCSVWQACKHHKNDFSVQGAAPCCPCHRAIYNTKFCITENTKYGELPACNMGYDTQRILDGVAFAHKIRKFRREFDRYDKNHFSSIPDFASGEKSIAPPYGRTGFDTVEALVRDRRNLNIVEIGSSWNRGDIFGNGYSTPYFARLSELNGHNFYSVDINPVAKVEAEKVLNDYGLYHDKVHLIVADGIEFLSNWDVKKNGEIDLLYLDGWDYTSSDLKNRGIIESEKKHRAATEIALPLIASKGYILFDDTLDLKTLGGKAREAIPFLAELGWECIEGAWQFLFRNPQ